MAQAADIAVLTPVRDTHRFDEAALARYLGARLPGDFDAMEVRQFAGGQSNPTFLLSVGDQTYVMRKKPPGKLLKSAHAVDREYRIMTALRDTGVPVPETHHYCEEDSVVGTPFFIMENVEGRVIMDVRLPSLSPEDRAALYLDCARVMAAIHTVDLEAAGLGDYGRPGNYYARQVSRWSKQYEASKTEDIPEMDALMAWLPKHIPETEETTIAHGDYRIGNCIIHPTEPRIVAVLDWELSTLGHPLADASYFCMSYHLDVHNEGPFPPPGSGIPSEEEFLKTYCAYKERGPIEDWKFYLVYNLFRTAAIGQGVYKRGLEGNASSEDWALRSAYVRVAAEKSWEMVEQAAQR